MQPDRKLRAKALAKEYAPYGPGGSSHTYLDGSSGWLDHDSKGLTFEHYPDHRKTLLRWDRVEKYIDLMIQSDRYLTDKEKEHYTPPSPVSAKPDADLTHAKNLIREFCQEEYDSEPDFSNLSKIGIAYTHATDEDIPIQVNVDLVGYRVERYLGEVLIDERQYESLEDLTETELEALDFSELVSVTDEELEHYHSKADERPALLPLDAATEYNALKEQYPDALVGFEQNGQFEFYGEDARKVCELLGGKLLEKETALGTVPVIGFPRDQWAYRAKQLWQRGETVYLAGLNEDGTHYQTKYLRREDYLPLGAIVHMEGRSFRVDTVNFDKGSVTLQDVALAEMRIPVFREEPLALVRELYEEQDMMESPLPDYKVGDNVVVELPTRTIEGKVGYVGETDVRIDTSAQGQSWDNEVINKRQFEDSLRQNEQVTTQPDDTVKTVAIYPAEENRMPYDIVIQTIGSKSPALDAVEPERSTLELAGNFRITDDDLGVGGPKQKYARNIEAIRTLFRLEEEHRGATAEEQQVLSQYVGWGGLADAFDPGKDNWAKEYAELKGLLSEDEYAAARSSTLNAHYTSPTVIRSIYDAVGRMGFRSGNILEPSMGVGNFFGMLPDTMQDSRLYGVELDSITGRIAKKLYPQADITVAGFETTDRRDFYDLAVGNVPFGQYRVNDKAYNKLGFSIHNYFFAKVIDQIRPGGVIAFLTSRYTMDSKDSTARKHMAERADLLGAIRLPDNAFKANAGTDVVSDIIFLQKRDRPADIEPAWVQLGKTEDGFAINQYFADHPEMILGVLSTESTQYGREELTVAPIEGTSLADQLAEAVQHIEGQYTAAEVDAPDIAEEETTRRTLPADPDVKNFSYTVVDGEVFYRENSVMTQVELSDTAKGRVTGMVELRQIVNELIDQQLNDYPDEDIKATQERLNAAYDAFTAKYGLLNDRKNGRLFEQDSSYYLLCSLENLDEQGQLKSKAAMFTKRTIRPERTVTSVDTPSEALAVSIGEHGKVDLPYMAELLGTPGEYGRITTELSGVIFKDPAADPTDPEAGWQMADEYLSGDVRAKLRMAQFAAETNPEFVVNVDALTKAQPRELEASEIDVRLGATWLNPDIIQKFMTETFQIPYYLRHAVKVRYSPYTAEWRVEGKTATGRGDIISSETYGTSRANAYKILEETLNLKDVRIYDTIEDAEGKPKRVLNKRETMLAQQKQQVIKDAFANWVWQDPQRRIALVKQYNELFNSTRPREYDGSHIHFVGMNPEITLREHQRNAIAHVLYGGNTLLAHEVGAGKTYEMAASAMEAKRLGLCQKSLFVVPNHLTEQWASEFLNLYPNAKLLVARRKDFETANRKKFCARIATGDYDAVIIGHSQFERIPLSFERQERIIQEQIYETLAAINELKVHAGENFSIKQMEKTRKTLETKLEKLRSDERKDDVITFEQLGVDRLFVDESHFYKNLFLTTKMRNVAGLSTSEAQKSSDMFGKCRYLDEITGGRGVVFATGTPVSNSMTELYTVMRYLQYSTLQQKKLTHFDCWASTFGETTTAIELAPEGTGYRARTRFAKFFNLPELMSMFKEVADIKTSDQLHLPVPVAKFETVVAKPSEIQKEMVQELSKRAADIHSGIVDASVDNMLCVTNDGRKIGLDVRLMNPMLPDDPNSKLNVCVQNVLKIWEEGKDQKLTQLLFCDLSTPKNDGNFNVYDDIRKKLIAVGVPENEIEFIHNADTEAKKAALFSKVRSGDVRVLLGSTAKMGAGTNVQSRLVAVHHLDVGWKPSDMTQRNGRIIRQGNMNKEVKVFNYVTEGTFDSYLFQTLENKQRFISQIMTSKSPVRSCEDVDEQALSYAEIKALCAGNPLIKEKMDLDVQVAKLKVLKADHQSQKFRLQDKLLTKFPADIQETNAHIAGLKADAQLAATHPQGKEEFCGMVIKGVAYDEKKTAGERLVLACSELPNAEEKVIGSYRGFELSLRFDTFRSEYQALLKGQRKYTVPLGTDPLGNIIRLDNSLNNFPERITAAENELDTLHQQQAAAQIEVEKPFPQEEELAEKSARLAELNAQLDVDEKSHEPEQDEEEQEDPPRRPSVLAALEEKSDKPEPVKPFRSYYDKDGDAR
ncbi:DEAD/DEAH box helicase family protein [Faecalibacterium sp. i20-0019-C2]|uniref:DEAD/DEAH box helicase family protein n=2 Tax=Oscillospiraceae TaxID=216572 RepID=UPI0036F3CE33